MCTVFVLTETKAEQPAEQTKNRMEIYKIKGDLGCKWSS